VPRIARPKSWNGFLVIDVFEAVRRLGRTEKAVRRLIDKKRFQKVPTGDKRVMLYAEEVDAFAMTQPHVQLKLLKGR
jgi:hypothetical protein